MVREIVCTICILFNLLRLDSWPWHKLISGTKYTWKDCVFCCPWAACSVNVKLVVSVVCLIVYPYGFFLNCKIFSYFFKYTFLAPSPTFHSFTISVLTYVFVFPFSSFCHCLLMCYHVLILASRFFISRHCIFHHNEIALGLFILYF